VSHLRDRVPGFVDGQLPHDVRDRVVAHLAGCPQCRAEVEAERVVKGRLAAMPSLAVPADLTSRLLQLAEPGGPLPPPRRPVGPAPRVAAVRSPSRAATAPGRPVARSPLPSYGRSLVALRRPRVPYLAVGGVGAMALALGAALLAGERNESGPAVVPAVDRFAVEHASTMGELPLLDPAAAVQAHFGGVPVPGAPPAGYGGYAVSGLYLGEVPPR